MKRKTKAKAGSRSSNAPATEAPMLASRHRGRAEFERISSASERPYGSEHPGHSKLAPNAAYPLAAEKRNSFIQRTSRGCSFAELGGVGHRMVLMAIPRNCHEKLPRDSQWHLSYTGRNRQR